MKNKLYLFQKTGRLTCNWVLTGDPKMPLACIWTGSKSSLPASTAPSSDETGRVHLCA